MSPGEEMKSRSTFSATAGASPRQVPVLLGSLRAGL